MALNDTRRNAAEAECARSATLASRCAPEHRHSCDRPAPDYNRFMSETTEVRCPNCQGQPDIIRLWQHSDCSDIGAKDKQPAHAALAHLGGGDLFASRRACPYPPGPRKGRTASLGDRPPIRRYTSANLPSRLPNGPPHSTQITCTCLCVGAASTRSTTYSAAQFGHRNGFRIDGWLELPERKRDNQHRHCTKHNHPARIHKLAPSWPPRLYFEKGPPAIDQRL